MSLVKATYESPSNIAIVKYWGKFGNQFPLNPSLSFTLSKSKTYMSLTRNVSDEFSIKLIFEGNKNLKFEEKIKTKLKSLTELFPWILKSELQIESSNTFPHSAGIASSASSMSALALCLVDIDYQINNKFQNNFDSEEFNKLASSVSRILSGSASRSIFKNAASWGVSSSLEKSSNEFASAIDFELPSIFKNLRDAILIVDSGEKSVSSSAGHQLMNNHPHRDSRVLHANSNFEKLLKALKNGDFKLFSEVSEVEALDLHAMMMTSNPSFILLSPNSLLIINLIRQFRIEKNIDITFTIDAGPNIHVLYPENQSSRVEEFLNEKILKALICQNIIYDQVGEGPKKIS
jgi:diphosphomevalonate decarboxylase